MKAKKIIWSILLVIFSLVLIGDLAVFFLIPDSTVLADESLSPVSSETGFIPEDNFSEDASSEHPGFEDGNPFFPGSGEVSSGSESEEFSSENSFPNGRGDNQAVTDGSFSAGESSEEISFFSFDSVLWLETVSSSDSLLGKLYLYAVFIRPYWLWILIGAITGILLCIFRLILLSRKAKKLALESPGKEASVHRKVALWPAFLLLLGSFIVIALLFPAESQTASTDDVITNESILSGTPEIKNLSVFLLATGSFSEQESVEITLPASVELSAVAVQNGDYVEKDQILAKVDSTSVMLAISYVQDALEEVDSQLKDAQELTGKTRLTAPVGGIVKKIYAEAGSNAIDVMNDCGSLALLSLDGRMAVELSVDDDWSAPSGFSVMLQDGTQVQGELTELSENIATIAIYDAGYEIGETVSVFDPEGNLIGSGPLKVHRELNIVCYLGTVTRIYRQEGASVTEGTLLMTLSDTANTASYKQLLEQRASLEEELYKLFQLYQNEYILSPENGVVSGLSDTIPYQNAGNLLTQTWSVQFMSATPEDSSPSEFVHYAALVTENGTDGLQLMMSPSPISVSNYSVMPAVNLSNMTFTGSYSISGSVPIYMCSGGSFYTVSSGSLSSGDLLLFAFNSNGGLVWVVAYHSGIEIATPTQEPTPTPSATPQPTSSESSSTVSPSPNKGGSQHSPSKGGSSSSKNSSSSDNKDSDSYVISEQILCAIIPQEILIIDVSIDELDILNISIGQSVVLYPDALQGKSFDGIVTGINPIGVNDGGNTKYSVTVTVSRTDQLLPGMNATVSFECEVKNNILTIPLAAVMENGNFITVYTAYDTEQDQLVNPVPIVTGISDGTDVEILSGLTESDTFFYRYADSITFQTN